MKNNIIGLEKKILDHGFIRVVDIMGNDSSIVQAARVSYGEGVKTLEKDRSLIRYLMRHKHTSPFEMCEIKFHLKMPMCIGEQWIRHRTANINKYSGRYSVLDSEFYITALENFARQSDVNRQGREEILTEKEAKEAQEIMIENSKNCYENYKKLLEKGVAKEIARMTLPANIYTQFYWKIDLHNLMHFMRLRSHHTSQWEIQQYSLAIEEIVKDWVPICYDAFVDYAKEAVMLSNVTKHLVSRNDKECGSLGVSELKEFNALYPKK